VARIRREVVSTTDIPLRAIAEGLVPNRFGTLNPTDGGRAWRSSLAFDIHETPGEGQLAASAFFVGNQLHLWNDFTHYLVDPVHGDQEDQFEHRNAFGGQASYTLPVPLGPIQNEVTVGALTRDDIVHLGRLPSEDRIPLPAADDPPYFSNDDQVYLFAGAAWAQATTHWTSTFRTVLGFREDYQHGTDVDYLAALHEQSGYTNGGTAQQALPQPKVSFIYAPLDILEFYLSAGRGFHSADLANGTSMPITSCPRAGASRSESTIFSTPTQPRRSFATSIGCRTRSAPIRTAVPTSTSIRSNPSPPVLPSRNAFDTNRH
jgi:hypothetical protein